MSKKTRRIVGGCFFGCTLLMGWIWQSSSRQVSSIKQNITLQNGQTTSLTFIPALRDKDYAIDLQFNKVQKPSLDCYTVQSSGIRWTIVRDGKAVQSGSSTDSNTICNDIGKAITISFLAPNFVLNHPHSLDLSVTNQRQQ